MISGPYADIGPLVMKDCLRVQRGLDRVGIELNRPRTPQKETLHGY